MRLALMHRRLSLLMALSALAAFAAGAALPPAAVAVTGGALVLGLFYQPDERVGERIERVVLVLSALLLVWALYQVFVVTDDIVAPVVALLLVLLVGESLRSLAAHNDARLYTLAFALLIAATAYLPGLLFGVAFVAFVVLSTLALMVGHLRRQAEGHGVAHVPIGRPFLLATTALSGVALAMAALVFLSFPRLPRNLLGRGISVSGATMAGFSEEVSLAEHGARIYSNPDVVLRVELGAEGDAAPSPARIGSFYWRGRSYETFDGVRWARDRRRLPRVAAPRAWYEGRWRGQDAGVIEQRVYATALDAHVLFGLHPAVQVAARSDIRPYMDDAGDLGYVGTVAPVYTVRSPTGEPTPAELRAAVPGPRPVPGQVLGGRAGQVEARLTEAVLGHYLQLPELPDRIGALADSLTRGLPTQYDRVVAVEDWLHTNFGYTLDLPATARETSLDYFLFERRAGHCEYFSTAMAVLLREVGIPARNVNGLLGGEWNDFGHYLAVTQNDAHSWVEVWFPGYGWVPFDPTPSGGETKRAGQRSYLGPFQFLLDGMQHRWNKWVIDYNLEKQVELFGRLSDVFSRQRSPRRSGGGGAPGSPALRFAIFVVLGLGVAAVLIARLGRGGPRVREESRLYLKLRRAYARRGWGGAAARGTATQWLERLRAEGAPAAPMTATFLELYRRRRFGGSTAGPAPLDELRALAQRIRDAVTAAPRGRKATARSSGPS